MSVFTLLKPRMWSVKNAAKASSGGGWSKHLILGTLGLGFWAGIFYLTIRVLRYLSTIEQIGNLLAMKLLSILLITAFALLIFSSILTSLTKLYLSRDLALVHSLPVPIHQIFTARWIDTTMDSSWMVLVYVLPVFIGYGVIYQSSPVFYIVSVLCLINLSIICSAISTCLVMFAVVVIPASRLKNIFIFIGLLLFLVLYILFRMIKPETMVDPEVFASVLIYLNALKTPSAPWLPTTWAFEAIKASLLNRPEGYLFSFAMIVSCAVTLTCISILIANAVYYKGFSKSQTSSARLFYRRKTGKRRLSWLPGPIRAFAVKEIRSFFRDQSQWSQIFLISGLIVIYIYNFKVLPLEKSPIETVFLQNLLSFLNMGLAMFVLTAITGRFAFPAISLEKESIWIVKSAPISITSFLWIKFFIYYVPLLVITETLIVITNFMLHVSTFMMIISTTTVFFMIPGIVALGIGLGAAYPDFKAENPVQTVTSFGGLLFMIFSALFIGCVIVLEAGPIYQIFVSGMRGWTITTVEKAWIILSFCLALLISALAILIPMKYGASRLSMKNL